MQALEREIGVLLPSAVTRVALIGEDVIGLRPLVERQFPEAELVCVGETSDESSAVWNRGEGRLQGCLPSVDLLVVSPLPGMTPRALDSDFFQTLSPGASVIGVMGNPHSFWELACQLRGENGGAHLPGGAGALERAMERAGLCVHSTSAVAVELGAEEQAWLRALRQAGLIDEGREQELPISHWLFSATNPPTPAVTEQTRQHVADAVASARGAGVDVGPVACPIAVRGVSRVSIVIPVHNGAEFTEKCLYAIAGNTEDDPDYEVIVVDNGSSDWTSYLLHAMEGDLTVLSNDRNLGFALACNQGVAEARGELVLLLNNDTVPHEGWLRELVAVADARPEVGIVGARLLYPDGRLQHAGLSIVDGLPEHDLRGVAGDDPRALQSRDLDIVTGACLMIRRELFAELGGFDRQFLNGVEDVDLCLRAREHGAVVHYCAQSVVDHHEAQSEGRFDHVQENVQRFLQRWEGRFDDSGRLQVEVVPTASTAVPTQTDVIPFPGIESGTSEPARLPEALSPVTTGDTAVVLLGAGELPIVEGFSAIGICACYDLDVDAGHSLGEQLETVRANAAGVKHLAILKTSCPESAARAVVEHLRGSSGVGMVCLNPAEDAGAGIEMAITASCCLLDTAILSAIGGFDASFQSAAVIGNCARAMVRQGWKVEPLRIPEIPSFPIQVDGDEIEAVRSLQTGDLHRDEDDIESALTQYRRALDLKADYAEAIVVCVDAELAAGESQQALATASRLQEMDSKSALVRNHFGVVHVRAGDPEGARRCFHLAIELNPELVDARVNLGVLEWEERAFEASLEQFRAANDIDPFNRDLVVNLGLVYSQIEDDSAAADLYLAYLQRYPDDVEVLQRVADIMEQPGDAERSCQLARQIIDIHPDHFQARKTLTKSFGNSGEGAAKVQ
ncbi:MAG: glycosyltransferase [Candidatus Latescibacterota bacterium]|nr:glycosyltransferase [Candidatus Latescibacterota bacterium]